MAFGARTILYESAWPSAPKHRPAWRGVIAWRENYTPLLSALPQYQSITLATDKVQKKEGKEISGSEHAHKNGAAF